MKQHTKRGKAEPINLAVGDSVTVYFPDTKTVAGKIIKKTEHDRYTVLVDLDAGQFKMIFDKYGEQTSYQQPDALLRARLTRNRKKPRNSSKNPPINYTVGDVIMIDGMRVMILPGPHGWYKLVFYLPGDKYTPTDQENEKESHS